MEIWNTKVYQQTSCKSSWSSCRHEQTQQLCPHHWSSAACGGRRRSPWGSDGLRMTNRKIPAVQCDTGHPKKISPLLWLIKAQCLEYGSTIQVQVNKPLTNPLGLNVDMTEHWVLLTYPQHSVEAEGGHSDALIGHWQEDSRAIGCVTQKRKQDFL